MSEPIYDYAFSGFGLSACILLEELVENGLTNGKQLLVLDADENPEKTWCYWEEGPGKWDALLSASWEKAWFIAPGKKIECLQSKLIYKCISSSALRDYILKKINPHTNIIFKSEKVSHFSEADELVKIKTSGNSYSAKKLFNSIPKSESFGNTPVLLQHFEGWFIKSNQLPFVREEMTLMDFTVAQKEATRFMYVLPFSETQALVEYTLFSPALIAKNEYESEIRSYLQQNNIADYEIERTESGVIPMTVYPFWKANTQNILHIGTAGGWTKPATGYTLMNAMKWSGKVVQHLKNGRTDFRLFFKRNRFLWYDRLFIDVLYSENAIGRRLFYDLFSKANPVKVLLFLKEKTTILEELQIILACPKLPFLKAAVRSLKKYRN